MLGIRTIATVAMETVSMVLLVLAIATIAMENVTIVIHILAHNNQSLATVIMAQNKSPWKRFPWLNSKHLRCAWDITALGPWVSKSLSSLGLGVQIIVRHRDQGN